MNNHLTISSSRACCIPNLIVRSDSYRPTSTRDPLESNIQSNFDPICHYSDLNLSYKYDYG